MASPAICLPELDQVIENIAVALSTKGYVVLEEALPVNLLHDLLSHFKSLDEEKFSRGGVGRDSDYQLNRFVRGDEIHWLNGTHPVTRNYFDWIEDLRKGLNRRLFLGLFDYECHYAWYPEGTFYKKHIDAFRGSNTRIVSTVLYLNPLWTSGDGGELVIYHADNDQVLETVEPHFGRLVIFLSEEFPHEVLPVNSSRYSLTGWFRVNNSSSDSIDPPR